jgi:hypothetical protein
MLRKAFSRQADCTPRRTAFTRLKADAAVDGIQADAQQISSLAPRHKTTRGQQEIAASPRKLGTRRSRSRAW